MLLALYVTLLASTCSAIASGHGTTVKTSEGKVQGTLVSSTVRQWLGIPYAADTSGSNRWKPPQAPPSIPAGSAFKATAYGDSCPQDLNMGNAEFLLLWGLSTVTRIESENCLSLNIWSPAVGRKQKTAVMVWIHGGTSEFGSSNVTYYNGQTFVQANDDVTIVTLNYRLNIFSSPTAPQLANGVQNYGLLDIDAAVAWVHRNIAAFGGDPDRIILFGESVGAMATDAYTFSHPHDNIVKGIIMESGSVFLQSKLASKNVTVPGPDSQWNTAADTVGCGKTPDEAQMACMRAAPSAVLRNAVVSNNLGFTIIPDEITFFSDVETRSSKGQFAHIPVLVGNNENEGDLFVVAGESRGFNTSVPGGPQALSAAFTDIVFTCPASQSARDKVKAGVPTYRYRYDGNFRDISNRTDIAACHTSEIPMVFGTYRSSIFPAPPTADEIALSTYMQGAWVAFARNPKEGLRGPGFSWPLYNPMSGMAPSLGVLGGLMNASGVNFISPAEDDAGCSSTSPLLNDVYALLGI